MKIAIFGLFFNFWKKNLKNRQNFKISNKIRPSNFWYFLNTWNGVGKLLKGHTLQILKKKFFQALAKNIFEKKKSNFLLQSKNRFFWKIDFRQNIHLKVVLPTSKYKKWVFWIILSIFGPGNFFHETNMLGSRGSWKFQFFEIFQNLGNFEKSQKIKIFQSP